MYRLSFSCHDDDVDDNVDDDVDDDDVDDDVDDDADDVDDDDDGRRRRLSFASRWLKCLFAWNTDEQLAASLPISFLSILDLTSGLSLR